MLTSRAGWRLGHRPGLDGVRGLAIVLVLLFHSEVPGFFSSGTIGVTVFFTLSGFLITALLLDEHIGSQRIALLAFFRRRAFRLFPALLMLVAVLVSISMVAGDWLVNPSDVPLVLFYVGNWAQVSGGDLAGLNHAWSLAVEEQFYLLWPLVAIVCLRLSKHLLLTAAIAGASASVLVRLAVWDDGLGSAHVYYGSDTRADGLLIGCALAIAMHGRKAGRARPRLATTAAIMLMAMSLVAGTAFHLLVPTLASLMTAVMVWAISRGDYAGWLSLAPFTWLGKRSYGLYLWHWPVAVAVNRIDGIDWPHRLLLVCTLSLPIVIFSWHFVEQPCLRWRQAMPTLRGARVAPVFTGTAS